MVPGLERLSIFCSHPTRVIMTGRMMLELDVCRVLRDVIPPTPPGPEGSNGNGPLRAQWVARYIFIARLSSPRFLLLTIWPVEICGAELHLSLVGHNCGVTEPLFS